MRIWLLLTLGIVLGIITVFLCLKIFRSGLSRLVIVLMAVCMFLGGGEVINLNTLSPDIEKKVQMVSDIVGDSYIKSERGDIYICIDDVWYDISKLTILGKRVGTITLEYEGKEIYVGDSGIVSTLKILEKFELLN